MATSRLVRWCTPFLAFGLGTTVLASDPESQARKAEEEALLRFQLAQQRLLLAQQQKTQPKAKVNPKPLLGVPTGAMPDGAIARLGDSRLRHAAAATCVTFSPDSRRIITGGDDGALRVWDVATGKALDAVQAPTGNVAVARFTHGGTRLATTFSNSRLQFLNPETLKEEAAFALGYGNEFAVSDDGKLIAGVGPSGALVVTELETGLDKLEVPIQSPANIHFAFRPGGKTIAVGERTGKVTFYKLAGGKPVLSFDHGAPLNGLVFSADGKRVATGSDALGGIVKVWDADASKTGKDVKPLAEISGLSRPQAWIGSDRIAVASREGAGVYDLTAKKWVGFVKGVKGEWAVSPDGTKVASTGSGALRIRVWDLTSGKQLHADNDTFPDAALLTPSADGQSVFVIAGDTGYIWPLGKNEASPAGILPARAIAAAIGGGRLVVATADGVLVYDKFDPAKGIPAKPSRTLTEFTNGLRSVAASPDGKTIAYSGEDTRIVIADAATGKTLRIVPKETIGLALAFTPDGSKLAVAGRDGFLRLWPLQPPTDGSEDTDLWRVRVPGGQRGSAVAFSPNGKLIAVTFSAMLKVVDAETGEDLFSLNRRDLDDGMFLQIAFTPDSRMIVTGSSGMSGAVHVFEVATQSLVRRYTTSFGAITRLNVFPDGSRAISAGAEEVVTVWDLTFRRGKEAPKTDELIAAWSELDALEGAKGIPAARTLLAGGTSSVRVMTAGLEELIETRRKIAQWVKDLASEEFAEREAASKALLEHRYQSLLAVQAAAANAESQEARTRATEILVKLGAQGIAMPASGLAGDNLRLVRAVQVLEDIGSAEARGLLEKIATLDGRAGDDAKAVLKRIQK